jgi:hypothetical protein
MTNIVPQRQPVPPVVLASMVEAELKRLTDAHETFTAYTVTLNLRDNTPSSEIPHSEVRGLVHTMMSSVVPYINEYDSETRMALDGNHALHYFWVDPANAPTVTLIPSQVPLLGAVINWVTGNKN